MFGSAPIYVDVETFGEKWCKILVERQKRRPGVMREVVLHHLV